MVENSRMLHKNSNMGEAAARIVTAGSGPLLNQCGPCVSVRD
jgi:hypothetical protein